MWIDIPYLDKWRVLYFTKTSTTLNYLGLGLCHMVFNATFNNISAISWQLVLLMEEPEYPEKTRLANFIT
jgi:predicted ATP-dependent endonuclease of OLD family